MMSLLAGIAALCLAVSCLEFVRTRYRRGLATIPGPFFASISNVWKVDAVYKGDMPRRNAAVHQRYGPVVRIGPNHVSFASPQALQIIHASRNAYAKSDFYKPTSPIYEGVPVFHLFSIQDQSYHASLKKNIAGLYTKAAVRGFEGPIDKCTMKFMDQLSKIAKDGPAIVNMSLWLHFFAFDCLGEINVSKNFGFLESGTDVRGMIAAADRILHMAGLYAQAPVLQMAQKVINTVWGVKKSNPLLMYTFSQVDERQKTPRPTPDLLNNFLKLHEAQPDKLSMKEITGALYINLMAGHDVLAITLRTIFYYLARSPRVLSKLLTEIDSMAKDYPLPNPIPSSQITSFSYLDAIINESLRIHPNTGLILERLVPPEGAVIDGYTLPGGTIVGVNAWVIHFNTDIYGEDVHVFRPERWLEASEEKVAEMKRNLFSFGAGPHSCIGRNIATVQISKVVTEFYRRFDAALGNPKKEWKVHGSWVTKQTEMDMVVTRRLEEKEEMLV